MRVFKSILLGIVAISLFGTPASAIDEGEMQAALQSRICPKEPIDTTHMPYYEACKPLEPDWWKVNECQNTQDRIWHLALKYNDFYKACHANDHTDQQAVAGTKSTSAALARAAQDAKKREEEARNKARQAADKESEARRMADLDKKTLRDRAAKLPSWCQGMISSCGQRASSLANASQSTQSQCSSYCQILQIENCNGSSSTVQQAAQACNAAAQRDQRQAMEDDRRKREEARRREEEERRREEENNFIPAGWIECSCPSVHRYAGKVVRGIRYHPRSVGDCS